MKNGSHVLIALLVVSVMGIFLAMWTDSNLEFWLSYFKGEQVRVPFFLSYIISVVCNAFIVAGNIIAEIAKLFVK